jgi:hypothetical protein
MLAGVAALAGQVAPSQAGYGDAANVFGKVTNKSGRSRQQQQENTGLAGQHQQSNSPNVAAASCL